MSFTLSQSHDGDYIIVTVIGDIDRQQAMKQNIEAHAYGKQLGMNKYLLDLTESRNSSSNTDNYAFSHKDMQTTPGIDRHAIVALLVNPPDHSHNFVETVSKNSGLNVTLFRDREAAIKHLKGFTSRRSTSV